MTISKIKFSTLGGPVYVGRPQGEAARTKLKLDDLDASNQVIMVEVPDNTYSINSSFFLGLFGPSVQKCGNSASFREKYEFSAPPEVQKQINKHIDRALFEKKHLIGKN